MKKAILLRIKPELVEKILNGKKTIEIRKSIPKIDLPCKVYIYCSKGQELWGDGTGNTWHGIAEDEDLYTVFELTPTLARLNDKVVAEFTLKNIEEFELWSDLWKFSDEIEDRIQRIQKQSCVPYVRLVGYLNRKTGYAWHIDDLIVYDKPKELSDFKKENKCHYANYEEGCCFEHCTFFDLKDCDGRYSKLYKAPQSYMYVEELKKKI